MVAFLGGTIGNLRPRDRAAFLTTLRGVLRPGERLLLGTSMVVDVPTMVAAYDDAQGVTAAFNRNVLRVLNRELAGRLRRRRVRPPRAVGRRATSGSRCGCGPGGR